MHGPNAYACPAQGCHPLVTNHDFSQGSSPWVTTGDTTIGSGYADVDSGVLYHDLGTIGSYQSMTISIDIDGITETQAGTERFQLRVGPVSSSEIVDVFWPSDTPSGQYDYNISNYSGQSIRVTLATVPGLDPGDAVLRVNSIQVWGRDF